LTTFTGGWVVAPNTIDWNFVFANADFLKNPTLYSTEIVIAVIYILAVIWARRQDKKDVEKVRKNMLKNMLKCLYQIGVKCKVILQKRKYGLRLLHCISAFEFNK